MLHDNLMCDASRIRYIRIAATQPTISGEWRLAALLSCTGSLRVLQQPLKQLQPTAERQLQSETVMSLAADVASWSPPPQLQVRV